MENSQSLPAMHQLTKRMKRERHETLQSVVAEFPRHDIICVVGDLNAKVGSCHNYCPEVMGKHGIGDMNENGALLVDFALNNDLVIGGILDLFVILDDVVPRGINKHFEKALSELPKDDEASRFYVSDWQELN
ncbi:hypothetical protein QYM36_002035 [Artemia franciscana]|uniref:Craniofacial development protein 2-like n=1 Tax=Artemia franciscana TaxID=6661 RepID=A0AA88IG10_ARTSF|nr:hypothetical protein QYM36_002035 [Artemia franciscana]